MRSEWLLVIEQERQWLVAFSIICFIFAPLQ
jgi:hypothetical protein